LACRRERRPTENVEENTGKPEQVTFGLPKFLIEALRAD
jgi:hypothetical protein